MGLRMVESTKISQDSIIGRLVVENGLCTAEDVQKCIHLRRQQNEKSDPNQRSLASLLIAKGCVTRRQLERLRPKIEESKTTQQIPGYQIIERLGAGAMATVYKARQLSLDRLVAIKILPQKFTNNPQFVERFYQEGKAAAKLNHPHIVQAFDVGQSGEYHYFVMEYVNGHTVYDDISKMGKYPEERALKIIIETALALEHAHQAGFIHRDVKPKNIMISAEDGTAKLADMGLARAVSDREAAEAEKGKAFGTPYYISPEQIRGKKDIDFRADIYSLGCTFYHMVTGKVPFEGANPSAVMHKHLKESVVPADHLNPSLSAGIGEVIEVCMAKDRNHRYSSTSDLLKDLQALAQGEAPMQARKKFDLASLAALEESTSVDEPASSSATIEIEVAKPAWTTQPLFWIAVGGWGLALILLILLIIFTGG